MYLVKKFYFLSFLFVFIISCSGLKIQERGLKVENKDFLTMLNYAIQAPSGHNSQPWKFKINKDSIEIHPDFTRELLVIDKNHRELYISLGAALANLCICANELSYNYKINIIDNNNSTFIRIDLQKGKTDKNPLFNQIFKRQSNRAIYNSKLIKESDILKLKNLDIKDPIYINFYKNKEDNFVKLSNMIYEGNKILFSNDDFKTELLNWMRFNKLESRNKKDGLAYDVLEAPSIDPRWLAKFIVKFFLTPSKQNKIERKKINSSSHLVLISSKENNPRNWILSGYALEIFFLKCSELGISLAFSNQPCEINSLANRIKVNLLNDNFPMLLMRIGYTNKELPYSKRRKLNDVIIN